jgi:hypothetical protein
MKTQKKRDHQRAVRTCVTLHPTLFDVCPELFRKHGYSGLSDYIQAKIRQDAGLELVETKN